jgi:hypothetical protein
VRLSYAFSRKYRTQRSYDTQQALKREPEKVISHRNWKPLDWIDHASFGVARLSESRVDKLDIDFVNGGRKTLLRSTILNRAVAPDTGSKFPRDKSKTRSAVVMVKKNSEVFTE